MKHRRYGNASDLTKPATIRTSRGDQRFYCPYCSEIRTVDTEGTLSYNHYKKIGYCFRCDSVIIDAHKEYNADVEVQKFLELYLRHNKDEEEEERSSEVYTLEGWTTPIKDNRSISTYLADRHIHKETIERFGLLACTRPFTGVVLPHRIFEHRGATCTDFYQIRNINQYARLKYRTPTDSLKPLYGTTFYTPQHELGVICEGVFSAISSVRNRLHCLPICTYGKTIKPDQLDEISKLPLEAFVVMYDGGEFYSLVKATRALRSVGKTAYAALLPFKRDPNSVTDEELNKTYSWLWQMDELRVQVWSTLYYVHARENWTKFLDLIEQQR